MTALLDIRSLSVGYGETSALDRVSLRVQPGEVVALIGANGAGKTTLMKSIMGFATASAGTVELAGATLGAMPAWQRARRGIAWCPEGRRVFPELTVDETLAAASPRGGDALETKRHDMFRLFPPLEQRHSALGGQLSGGEQQMLAIARALMTEPKLLLLDEPSLGLSPLLVDQVFARIRDIVASGASVLLAEQNVTRALEVADRAYVLRLGRVEREGKASELRQNSALKELILG
jgi:branched-chain amino acid transport system ATP-binding protein